MRINLSLATALALPALIISLQGAAAQTRTTLDIYVVDVEGGNATLFVSPSGESVLIDSGNVGAGGRARRRSHHGGGQGCRPHADRSSDHDALARRSFRRHGGAREAHPDPPLHRSRAERAAQLRSSTSSSARSIRTLYGKAKHTVAKPGDTIAVAGLDWRIVTSAGEAIKTPAAGRREAPIRTAPAFKPQEVDPTENAQSVGSVITFGKFRIAHLGDLTWNKEFDLMCPMNRIGTVDLFVVSHHGQADLELGSSGARAPRRASPS